MTVDERLEAIAHNLDTLTRIHLDNGREYRERFQENQKHIETLLAAVQQDAENIRTLARIAEIHERRPTDLEGGDQPK